MEQKVSTLTRVKTFMKKQKYNEEASKNCNTEFDFVSFVTDIPLELANERKKNLDVRKDQVEGTLRGSLWFMSDSFLSRWRQQFVVLTKNSIYCFNEKSGSTKSVSKIQLTDIVDVKMIREKGQLILCLEINNVKRLMFRSEEGIREWYDNILANIAALRAKNYRRCFSNDNHRRNKRPLMGLSSLTYAL